LSALKKTSKEILEKNADSVADVLETKS